MIRGDLTPECAQVVRAVLDALSARAGAEDGRSHEQRYHDALQEAMTRLVAAGLVPQRPGQPVKVLAHVTLADLMLREKVTAFRADPEVIEAMRASGVDQLGTPTLAGGETWRDVRDATADVDALARRAAWPTSTSTSSPSSTCTGCVPSPRKSVVVALY